MAYLLYFLYLLVIIFPGVMLLFAVSKFKSKIHARSGLWMLLGGIMILLHLVLSSGNYLIATFGDAQDLANFAEVNFWIQGGLKYLGLILLSTGVLIFVNLRQAPETENLPGKS